jgi:hypothetical protein
MKYLINIVLFSAFLSSSQIGINTTTPSGAAVLDINSTRFTSFGGLKLPTVTENQRDNQIQVTAASEGILVYVQYNNGDRCLEIYDGIQGLWQKLRCTDFGKTLFISEYVESSIAQNKYIELYNPTNTTIDLSNYKILIFRNGGDFPIGGTDREIPLIGSLAPGSTFVIAHENATLYTGTVDQVVPLSNPLDFNGDDPVALADVSNTILDVIGILGTDPGTGYAVDGSTTQAETIRRIPAVQTANATWTPAEWQAVGDSNVSGLGGI